jgi:hypothetical protein
MVEPITKHCIRCTKKFQYGDMTKALSGQMSRKYCDTCRILQRKENGHNEWLKQKRMDAIHENTQGLINKDLLLE